MVNFNSEPLRTGILLCVLRDTVFGRCLSVLFLNNPALEKKDASCKGPLQPHFLRNQPQLKISLILNLIKSSFYC